MRLRYNRQELIDGWDQEKLSNAKVAIIGDGSLAEYIALPLAAMGIGELRIIGDSNGGSFLDFTETEGSKAKYLEECLKKVNPDVDIYGINAKLDNYPSAYFLDGVDIVIDTTNDSYSKAIALGDVPFISASSKKEFGRYSMLRSGSLAENKHLMTEFDGEEQDPFVSMVLGGIVADEVKKLIMGGEPQKDFLYSPGNKERFTWKAGEFSDTSYREKKALIIGAGALGNFVALGLAELGVGKVDIIDHDTIEDTNLNRQILFYDSVGGSKASVLASKIEKMNKEIKARAIEKRFDETFEGEYDIIFDCVDNFETRAQISEYAVRNGIPVVSGGTDFKSGQVAVYAPGKACLDCQLNLSEFAKKSKDPQGCIDAPNPSVIFTNQVIAGLMVNEGRRVLSGNEDLDGRINYNSFAEGRAGIAKKEVTCEHGKRV